MKTRFKFESSPFPTIVFPNFFHSVGLTAYYKRIHCFRAYDILEGVLLYILKVGVVTWFIVSLYDLIESSVGAYVTEAVFGGSFSAFLRGHPPIALVYPFAEYITYIILFSAWLTSAASANLFISGIASDYTNIFKRVWLTINRLLSLVVDLALVAGYVMIAALSFYLPYELLRNFFLG